MDVFQPFEKDFLHYQVKYLNVRFGRAVCNTTAGNAYAGIVICPLPVFTLEGTIGLPPSARQSVRVCAKSLDRLIT